MAMSQSRLEIILYSIVIVLLVFILFLMMNNRKEYFKPKASVATTTPAPIPNCPIGYKFNNIYRYCEYPKESIITSCPPYFSITNDQNNCVLSSCPDKFKLSSDNKSCVPEKIISPNISTVKNITKLPLKLNCGSLLDGIILKSEKDGGKVNCCNRSNPNTDSNDNTECK